MSRLTFFIGKGGVGKTTVAAAYAVQSAIEQAGKRVLLVSTDPAHSIGDVLRVKLSDSPKQVPLTGRAKLLAWELDPPRLFRDFLGEYRQGILEIVESGSLFNAEEISPLLDTALPGMAEISALLAIREAMESGKYSQIVVDTAPFGHTLRLFSLPEQFERLLNFLDIAAGRDRILAEHFGGSEQAHEPKLVGDWQGKVKQLKRAFSDSDLFLVTTAEKFSLNESVRCISELQSTSPSFKLRGIVLNRVVKQAGSCPPCKRRATAARAARLFLRKHYSYAKLHVAEDPGFPILGTNALRRFGAHVFSGRSLNLKPEFPKLKKTQPQLTAADWPVLKSSLSFVLGKGGVGKTTISAALGCHTRERSNAAVEICSVDPAPSLDDIFQTEITDTAKPVLGDKKFRASEMDSVLLFRNWIAEIRNEIESATTGEHSGIHVDLSFERQLLSALLEIVPPGLDEVLAIFPIMELRAGSAAKIIIDMAPTGHALELLRMPERIVTWSRLLLKALAAHRKLALARNAAVRIAELELRARGLTKSLKDSKEASVFAVMLPEPLPDRETERLLDELDGLGLTPKALFVNRIIFPEDTKGCRRCGIARRWQTSVLQNLKKRVRTKDIFAVRNFPDEIVGAKGLRTITRKLWRVV